MAQRIAITMGRFGMNFSGTFSLLGFDQGVPMNRPFGCFVIGSVKSSDAGSGAFRFKRA